MGLEERGLFSSNRTLFVTSLRTAAVCTALVSALGLPLVLLGPLETAKAYRRSQRSPALTVYCDSVEKSEQEWRVKHFRAVQLHNPRCYVDAEALKDAWRVFSGTPSERQEGQRRENYLRYKADSIATSHWTPEMRALEEEIRLKSQRFAYLSDSIDGFYRAK